MARRLTDAEKALRAEKEADFQKWLTDYARHRGWMTFWIPDWMYRLALASLRRRRRGDREWPDKGFPDVWCLHPRRGKLVVFECKTETGKTSPEQDMWLAALQNAGIECHVARPRHRPLIEKILDGRG